MTTDRKPTSPESRWIWPFELLEQIGEGGMGVVYRARYVVNGREVALKMLPSDVNDETALARFERELEVLKNLKHPNIVRCFGGACENRRRFYAMELVEGGSLEDKLQEKKQFPWEQVIYFALQMCDALTCSHAAGVVHRDIKPGNFLLAHSGQLKLSDFGLASVADSRRITAAGKTAGTFLYMAPEQIRGQEITDKTDLYALGCVLYELITGTPPFIGETPAATLHMHCQNMPVRPSEKALDCPIALERIILQLLEKDPANRPESAQAVMRQLRSVKQSVVVTRPTPEEMHDRLRTGSGGTRAQAKSPKSGVPLPSPVAPTNSVPRWVAIALGITLACSLSWNIIQVVQRHSGDHGEMLWVRAAHHADPDVRIVAIESLGTIHQRSGRHLSVLETALQDIDPEVRQQSAHEIGQGGRRSRHLIPVLIRIQKNDADARVRDSANRAVQNLQGTVPETKPEEKSWIGWAVAVLLTGVTTLGIYHWFKTSSVPRTSPLPFRHA
ncbi:protein kinase [Thalassoglobus sp. JC818]|uniref:serine/threonine-protein kinase n=1 Tax=Thalassoglobus sp. JC818 TaxID=3232136 RepID=UPI00345939DD